VSEVIVQNQNPQVVQIRNLPGPQGPPGAADDGDVAAAVTSGPLTTAALNSTYEPQAERGLRTFHAALGQRQDTPVKIMGLGHSFMEGQGATENAKRWWERFQQIMRNRYPMFDGTTPKGRGYIPSFYVGSTLTDPVIGGSGSSTVQVNDYAPGGRSLFIPVGRTLTYSLVGTKARILYTKGPSTGTMTITVDGTPQTSVATAGASVIEGNWVDVPLGASGAHTLVIGATAAAIYVGGVEEYDGNETKGFQFIEAARTGWKISDMHPILDQNFWNVGPMDLYICEFGINEWTAGNVSPATFKTNLDGLVARIREQSALASILFVIDYQNLGTYTYTWDQMAQVYFDTAESDLNIAVLDLRRRMPNATTAAAGLGLSVSDGHPSDKGHLAYAETIASFIEPR